MSGCSGKNRRKVPFRGGGFTTRPVRHAGWVVLAVLIAVLEWGTRAGWIAELTLPRPSNVAMTLAELYRSGLLWTHLAPSLLRLLIGSALGVGAGVLTGLMMGLFSYVRAGLLPLVAALFPVPKIALLPLFVIWFGIGEASKYALIAFGAFMPMVVATYGAVDNVDRTLVRMGQSYGLSWLSIVRKIILPGALPGIFSGLRISLAIAIILLVAAEMIGAEHGIGAYILQAGSLYDLERLFTGVVILSVIGLIISKGLDLLERRLLRWRN